MKEHFDFPGASKIGLESVPLWRITFQSDALSALRGVADFHASVAKHFGIDDSVTDLELSVATTNLNLQVAVEAADTTVPIGWNLQDQLSIESDIIRIFDLDTAVNFVRYFRLPTPGLAVHQTRWRKSNLHEVQSPMISTLLSLDDRGVWLPQNYPLERKSPPQSPMAAQRRRNGKVRPCPESAWRRDSRTQTRRLPVASSPVAHE